VGRIHQGRDRLAPQILGESLHATEATYSDTSRWQVGASYPSGERGDYVDAVCD
jgi:hypothetical protein